jgi:hypothetical protein
MQSGRQSTLIVSAWQFGFGNLSNKFPDHRLTKAIEIIDQ